MPFTRNRYHEVVGQYIVKNFGCRGIEVYSEVHVGTSLIGSSRSIDLLVSEPSTKKVFGIECKYQNESGSVQEKLIYALEDLANLRIAACLVYAGDGFTAEIRHHLMRSPWAAYFLPPEDLSRKKSRPSKDKASSVSTQQLDLSLAVYFDWWDILIGDKEKFQFDEVESFSAYQTLKISKGVPPEKPILDGDAPGISLKS